MKRFRKYIVAVVAALLLPLSVPEKASSQILSEDVLNYGINVTNWITAITNAADQLQRMGVQIEIAEEQVEKFKNVYHKVNQAITAGRLGTEIYRASERVINSCQSLGNYVQYCTQSGHMSPEKMNVITGYVSSIWNQINTIINMAQEFISALSDLTNGERAAELEKQIEELDEVAGQLERFQMEDIKDIVQSIEATAAEVSIAQAMGMPISASLDASTGELTVDLSGKDAPSVTDDYVPENFSNNSMVENIFDFVTMVIGILALLMIVWAFARRGKDPQHQDALWKVFVGLVFILLMLELIKTCFFGPASGIILPNF